MITQLCQWWKIQNKAIKFCIKSGKNKKKADKQWGNYFINFSFRNKLKLPVWWSTFQEQNEETKSMIMVISCYRFQIKSKLRFPKYNYDMILVAWLKRRKTQEMRMSMANDAWNIEGYCNSWRNPAVKCPILEICFINYKLIFWLTSFFAVVVEIPWFCLN